MCNFCYIVAVFLFMLQGMDKPFKNPEKRSQIDVLQKAALSDKPLYMLSKKEIDEILFSKRDK